MNDKVEPICKNCLVYDFEKRLCRVIVLYEGTRMQVPTDPDTPCIFENEYISIDDDGKVDAWKPEVKQIRCWVEDPKTGKPTDGNGIVKIEYPAELDDKFVDDIIDD